MISISNAIHFVANRERAHPGRPLESLGRVATRKPGRPPSGGYPLGGQAGLESLYAGTTEAPPEPRPAHRGSWEIGSRPLPSRSGHFGSPLTRFRVDRTSIRGVLLRAPSGLMPFLPQGGYTSEARGRWPVSPFALDVVSSNIARDRSLAIGPERLSASRSAPDRAEGK